MQTDKNLILAYQRIAELERKVDHLTTLARRLIEEAEQTNNLIVADETRRLAHITRVVLTWPN
jgi:hypothetical protein